MSQDAQTVAIAEACGLVVGPLYSDGARWCDSPRRFCGSWLTDREPPRWHGRLPAYLTDLNAMHEAEKVLTDEQWPMYYWNLILAETGDKRRVTFATAAQRAEAFLRCLGKWKE